MMAVLVMLAHAVMQNMPAREVVEGGWSLSALHQCAVEMSTRQGDCNGLPHDTSRHSKQTCPLGTLSVQHTTTCYFPEVTETATTNACTLAENNNADNYASNLVIGREATHETRHTQLLLQWDTSGVNCRNRHC
jgi:hypothetical protein